MTFAEKYGRWALITGASEGTGAAFALRLADAGLNLILVARREGPLDELAAAVRRKGAECVTASVDLSRRDASDHVIAAAAGREVGLFIANAGADTNGSMFFDKNADNWEALINLNVITTMRNCHHFGKAMRDRGKGGMILVGSGACYGGLNGLGVYCGSKAFDLCFGEGLWAELRHDGVDVLNLILGRTDTPAHRRLMERNGQTADSNLASSDDVARIGLEQLPHGPVYNWGSNNDVPGFAPSSPDTRRARIIAVEQASGAYTGKK